MVAPRHIQVREAAHARVALAMGATSIAREAAAALTARGLPCDAMSLDEAVASAAPAIAFAFEAPPSPRAAAELAPRCARAAAAGRPLVVLAAFGAIEPREAVPSAAALAHLRASGAILCADPDVWLETLVLVAAHGIPAGPAVALVAPPDTWLAASAAALDAEWSSAGSRLPAVSRDAARLGPADLALVDRAALPADGGRSGRALVVPVAGRAELVAGDPTVPLVGLRAALGAATLAGRFAERLAAGLGPAEPGGVEAERERFERQAGKLAERAGDHETKVLLASYGIPITRQAVATTASAATRLAKRAGYPVEVKPWGPDVPAERDGCPVEVGITTAAEVRRAFAAVSKQAELPLGSPVIIRETPPTGRDVRAELRRLPDLGWTVILDIPGTSGPLAAPAPLRPIDAAELARHLEASRAGDPPPDRDALADILRRASHLVVDHDHLIAHLELSRIIVTGPGETSVVADAYARLTPR